ncbi:putative transcription rho factor [Bacillus phage BSP15]|nr:putative transcription rho factor [Bacillus phage BSP9]AYJ74161.1 putative transcription rho factor [Bacillus phage BSP15]
MYAKFTGGQYEAYKKLREDYRIPDHALQVIYTYHGTRDWEEGPYAPLNEVERYSLVQAVVNDHYEVRLTFVEKLENMIKDQTNKVDSLTERLDSSQHTLSGPLTEYIIPEVQTEREIALAEHNVLRDIYLKYIEEQEGSRYEAKRRLNILLGEVPEPTDDDDDEEWYLYDIDEDDDEEIVRNPPASIRRDTSFTDKIENKEGNDE